MKNRQITLKILSAIVVAGLIAACSVMPPTEPTVGDSAASRAATLTTLKALSQSWTAAPSPAHVDTTSSTITARLYPSAESSSGVGSTFSFSSTVPSGTYSVKVDYDQRNVYGTYSLKINGTQIGSTFDAYNSSTGDLSSSITLGNVTLPSTASSFVFTLTGKNSAATAYDLKVIDIVLTPTTGSTPVPTKTPTGAPTKTPTATATPAASFTIYSIGDSTMADYDTSVYAGATEQRGWCQLFPTFISNTSIVKFYNGAKNGRSSRSFTLDPANSWGIVKAKLKKGDYLFIQFAHNDEKLNGAESTEDAAGEYGRGTNPWQHYTTYLNGYIDQARAIGATPILFGPVVRLSIGSNGKESNTACHDLGTPPDTSLNYVAAMKAVATAKNCPYMDLTADTKALVESYGATQAKSIIYVNADNTHLKAEGARLFAQLAAKELLAKGFFTGLIHQ